MENENTTTDIKFEDLINNISDTPEDTKKAEMTILIDPEILAELTVYLIKTSNKGLINLHAKYIKKVDIQIDNYDFDDTDVEDLKDVFTVYYKTLSIENPEKYIKFILFCNISLSIGSKWIEYLTDKHKKIAPEVDPEPKKQTPEPKKQTPEPKKQTPEKKQTPDKKTTPDPTIINNIEK